MSGAASSSNDKKSLAKRRGNGNASSAATGGNGSSSPDASTNTSNEGSSYGHSVSTPLLNESQSQQTSTSSTSSNADANVPPPNPKVLVVVFLIVLLVVYKFVFGGSDQAPALLNDDDLPASGEMGSLEDEAAALGLGGDDVDSSEEGEGENGEEDSKKKKKKSKSKPDENVGKNKKLLKGVDIIEAKGRGGWLPGKEKLVEKRPPRECPIKHIGIQVFDPIVYNSKTPQGQTWMRRAYTCLYKDQPGCRPSIIEDFDDRKLKVLPKGNVDATFIQTNLATLNNIKETQPELFNKIYFEREGKTYIDTILGSDAMTGNILEQYVSREKYVKKFGCSLNDIKIQTPRYRTDIKSDCKKFISRVHSNTRRVWVKHEAAPNPQQPQSKPVVKTSVLLGATEVDVQPPFKSACAESPHDERALDSLTDAVLMVQGIDKPLLIQKKLFDVRGYMLIASTMPYMVFFRRGYIRRAEADFSASDKSSFMPGKFDGVQARDRHLSLEKFQQHFANAKVTGTHYVDTHLHSAMKQIANFVFHSSRTSLLRRRGSYQLFSIDYLIDENFRVYLEKTDGFPELVHNKNFDVGQIVAEMHDLLLELNEEPVAFEAMGPGDKYGGWELIFSELRETCEGNLFNPCHSFFDFNARSDLRKSNRKAGLIHNSANREKHEQTRVVKKVEENKKNKCKVERLHYPGAVCDKLMKTLWDTKMKEKFALHEKEFVLLLSSFPCCLSTRSKHFKIIDSTQINSDYPNQEKCFHGRLYRIIMIAIKVYLARSPILLVAHHKIQ